MALLPLHARGQAQSSSALLTRWLQTFNDRRAEAYAEFVRANIPSVVEYLDEDLGVREGSGGFDLLRVEETPGQITGWLKDRNWDRFSKVILSVTDNTITDLSFVASPAPDGFSVRRMSEADALSAFRGKMDLEAGAGRFSGSFLVARGRQVILRAGHGSQDPSGTRPVTPDTRFCIGSMDKMFTAVSVLQLVQSGRLALDRPIAELLPEIPRTPLSRSATVRHLLTHTGGTGDFIGPEYERRKDELRRPADFVRAFGARDAAFAPGSRWAYSNFGYILLGAIVEQVSGDDWEGYRQRNIFRVAGMTNTSGVATAADTALPLVGAAATGLRALPHYVGLPAGSGYSTVTDLHRFAVALQRGALLDPAHRQMVTTAHVPAGTAANWSLGLRVERRNGETFFGHGGGAPGVNAQFAIYPRSGYTVIVLSNRGNPHAANPADFIAMRLPSGSDTERNGSR